MGTRKTLMLVLAGALFALIGCAAPSGNSTGGATSGGNTITLQNLAFNPSSLTVKTGDTVTIKNADQAPHHIVIGTDDLGEQAPGDTKTWKAPKDGVYMMKCVIHPSMSGQITVGAGGSSVGSAPAGGGAGGGGGGGVPGY